MGMKRANGTGCVTKLSGTRREPWYAKVPIGVDDQGRVIQKILSDDTGKKYFADRTIPDLLLANWNKEKGNININKADYTFSEVYAEYSKANFPTKEEARLEKQTHKKTVRKTWKF